MAADGFASYVGNLPAAARRGMLELKRLVDARTRLITGVNKNVQISVPVGVTTYLTDDIDITLQAGRRYRLAWNFRALARQDNSTTPTTFRLDLYDGTTSLGWIDHWNVASLWWGSTSGFEFRNGDGVARSLRIATGGAAVALYIYPTWFTIEDVGPAI